MGEAQGKKVVSDGVAAQTIEAQPVFGQIKPSQRPGASRAETRSREKSWLISVVLYKRSERFGEEKETVCGKWRSRCPRATAEQRPCMFIRSGVEIHFAWSRYSGGILQRPFAQAPNTFHFRADLANLFDDERERIIPRAWRP